MSDGQPGPHPPYGQPSPYGQQPYQQPYAQPTPYGQQPYQQVPPQYAPVSLHWTPPPPPARRPRGRFVALLVVVLVLGGLVAADRFGLTAALGLPSLSGPLSAQRLAGWPTPGHEVAAAPLGTPPTVPTPSTSYTFQSTQADGVTPVAYDPCRPIHYVTRTEGAPPEGAALIAGAIADVSAATGLVFVDDGATTEAPGESRPLVDTDRYGDRWAPVLVAWVSPDESAQLGGDVIGRAGSTAVARPSDGTLVYVTGEVQLDAGQLAPMLANRAGETEARLAIAHELAHVVGLGHSQDPSQAMYPILMSSVLSFGDGDRTGLAQLGAGTCAPDL